MNSTEDFTSTLRTSTAACPPESYKEVKTGLEQGFSVVLVAEDCHVELQSGENHLFLHMWPCTLTSTFQWFSGIAKLNVSLQ